MKPHQWELSCSREAFNLAGQEADDPARLAMEEGRRCAGLEAARQYEARMQRLLSECPGFSGCDAPRSASCSGKVVIEPGRIVDAMPWLKRRFHVNQNLELSTDTGLCVEIKPRERRSSGKRSAVKFGKPEQFEFSLKSDNQ